MTVPPDPTSPPPGWYPDPVSGTGHRYWNGSAWTEEHSLDDGGAGGGFQPAGSWMGETFRLVISRAGQLFVLIAALALPTALMAAAATYFALQDVVLFFNEEGTEFDVEGFETGPLLLMLGAMILNLLAGFVLSAAVARHVVFARTDRDETWNMSLAGGLRRGPRVLGITIVLALGYFVCVGVLITISSLAPALLIVTIPVIVVGSVWMWVRMTLVTTAAAVGPSDQRSISTSLRLTSGVFTPLLGRLLLMVLILVGAQVASAVINAPLAALGSGPTTFQPGDTELRIIDIFGGNPAVFALQQLVGAMVGGFVAALYGAGMAILYLDLGGPLDEEFASPIT